MSDKWMEIFKDEIAEKVNEGRNEGWKEGRNEGWKTGRNEGQIYAYNNMVATGLITAEQAAGALNMTVEEFRKAADKVMVVA